MKVAIFSTQKYDREYFEKFEDYHNHELTYFKTSLNKDTVELARGYPAICVFVNDKLDDKTLELLSRNGVRLIALRCAGHNNVDLKAANQYGLTVLRVPAYSPEAIAEHALALILTLNRKTHKAYNRVREGNFSLENLTGFNLNKKTVGVIGTGKIGAIFSEIMMGLGCQILAYDINESDILRNQGVKYVSMENIFLNSDIISLHCPLTEETIHIIDREALLKMKDGVMIINTSRGGLIKTEDVIDALLSKKIGYLGIDVYEQEENLFFKDLSESIIEDDMILRLNSFPNVLITSHQAFFTKEALDEIALVTLQNITDFESRNTLKNEVRYINK
ncbi:MAG TPA: hydroxyacid dehydrogenase [Bacteroidales bacterium]|nr:hydroxyacid dehydrogenase [Bacteroidales bacterium]